MLLCSFFNLFTLPNISSSYKDTPKSIWLRYFTAFHVLFSLSPFLFSLCSSRNHYMASPKVRGCNVLLWHICTHTIWASGHLPKAAVGCEFTGISKLHKTGINSYRTDGEMIQLLQRILNWPWDNFKLYLAQRDGMYWEWRHPGELLMKSIACLGRLTQLICKHELWDCHLSESYFEFSVICILCVIFVNGDCNSVSCCKG